MGVYRNTAYDIWELWINMVTLPTADKITRTKPQSASGVASVSPTYAPNVFGGANIQGPQASKIGQAIANIGEAVTDVSVDYLEKKAKARKARTLAMAKSDWLRSQAALKDELNNDDEYDTIQNRYMYQSTMDMQRILSNIDDPEITQALELDMADDVFVGDIKMKNVAQAKYKDFRLGQENKQLDDNLKRIGESTDLDEQFDLMGANVAIIDAQLAEQIIDNEKHQNKKDTYMNSAASAMITSIKGETDVETLELQLQELVDDPDNDFQIGDFFSSPSYRQNLRASTEEALNIARMKEDITKIPLTNAQYRKDLLAKYPGESTVKTKVSQFEESLKKDPMGTAMQHPLYVMADQTHRELMEQGASPMLVRMAEKNKHEAAISAQQQLGVPAYKTRTVPLAVAEQLQTLLQDPKATAQQQMDGLDSLLGQYKGSELMLAIRESGGIGAASVAFDLEPNHPHRYMLMQGIQESKNNELKSSIGDKEYKDIQQAIQESDDLEKYFEGVSHLQHGTDRINDTKEAVRVIAVKLAQKGDATGEAAVKAAVESITGGYHNINGTLVPKSIVPERKDVSRLLRRKDKILSDYDVLAPGIPQFGESLRKNSKVRIVGDSLQFFTADDVPLYDSRKAKIDPNTNRIVNPHEALIKIPFSDLDYYNDRYVPKTYQGMMGENQFLSEFTDTDNVR